MVLAAAILLGGSLLFIPRARKTLKSVLATRQYLPPWYHRFRAGDGKAAIEIRLQDPMGIGEDQFGNVYLSDRRGFIWKVDHRGKAHIIAGTGRRGAARAGTGALNSDLGSPEGLCVDRAGRVYFADSENHVVLRIEEDGRLTRIAGTGAPGYGGDGGPAIEAALNKPYDVRLDSQGNLYIADFGNHRIRKLSREGMIRTVAGTGEPGYAGDGGLAAAARLNGPYGVFVAPGDALLIADSLNHVIRRVDENGIITTIAGVGRPGYAGDGGPARAAMFDTPQSLYVDGAGRIYVGDEHNHSIRTIGPDGTVSTLIGLGVPGFARDGLPAAQAPLNDPENLIVHSGGSILITDGDNGRVLSLKPDGRTQAFAGRGRHAGR